MRDGKAPSAFIVSALLSRENVCGYWLTDKLSRAETNLAHHLQCSHFLFPFLAHAWVWVSQDGS